MLLPSNPADVVSSIPAGREVCTAGPDNLTGSRPLHDILEERNRFDAQLSLKRIIMR